MNICLVQANFAKKMNKKAKINYQISLLLNFYFSFVSRQLSNILKKIWLCSSFYFVEILDVILAKGIVHSAYVRIRGHFKEDLGHLVVVVFEGQ